MGFHRMRMPGKDGGRRLGMALRPPSALTITAATGVAAFVLELGTVAHAQVPVTLNGPPVQLQPYVSEVGAPTVTVTTGTVNPFAGADAASTSDSNDTGGSSGSDGGSGGGSTGGNVGSSSSLTNMLGTSWGSAAVSNADALGVNPSALAATCQIESGCQNVRGSGSVAGAFQMTASTYTAMINAAVADNPNLASQIVPGLAGQMDPASESIAAAEYLKQGAAYLQANGIPDPTALQVRGYYNFGPAAGAAIANASPDQTMANVLSNYSSATLAKNGITPGETVGQWQAGVSAKMGDAATQSVLS